MGVVVIVDPLPSWLTEFDFVHVEGDRGQIEVDGVVGVAVKDAPAGGDL